MSKQKFTFEGFRITKKWCFEFEITPPTRRLYLPSPPQKGMANSEVDDNLGHIQYHKGEPRLSSKNLKERKEKSYDVFSAGRNGIMKKAWRKMA